MLNKTIKYLLIASTFHVASSIAGVIDIEGSNTSGSNDTTTKAQDLGIVTDINPLTVSGWVDSNNEFDVDFYQFSVMDPSLSYFFDIDFADDWDQVNHPGDNDLGLDTALWLFNSTGELIAWNDDSDFFELGVDNQGTDPGSDSFGDYDSFIGGLSLATGNYYAAVSNFASYADALNQGGLTSTQLAYSGYAISGATPNTNFTNDDVVCVAPNDPLHCIDPADPENQRIGQYQLQIRTSFDQPATVPTPGAVGLLGSALAVFIGWSRRKKAVAA